MSGKEIYEMLLIEHNNYIKSISDEENRPEVKLTIQQCCKLADHLGYTHRYYISAKALAVGDLSKIDFGSVIVRRKND